MNSSPSSGSTSSKGKRVSFRSGCQGPRASSQRLAPQGSNTSERTRLSIHQRSTPGGSVSSSTWRATDHRMWSQRGEKAGTRRSPEGDERVRRSRPSSGLEQRPLQEGDRSNHLGLRVEAFTQRLDGIWLWSLSRNRPLAGPRTSRRGAGGLPGLRPPRIKSIPDPPNHSFTQARATPSIPRFREKTQDRHSGRLCCMRGSSDAAGGPLNRPYMRV